LQSSTPAQKPKNRRSSFGQLDRGERWLGAKMRNSMRARAKRSAAFLLMVFAGACSDHDRVAPDPRAPLVLISIDTLRADHLPLYGYREGATPAIDALGREGVVFEEAFSHCPLTLVAHASMFTGLLPPRHGVRDNLGFTLKAGTPTLASRLKATGARTGGAVSAYVLRSQTGIAQGFDFYDDAVEVEGGGESIGQVQRDGVAAVDALSGWIERQGAQRFFAFLHLYEPHSPYKPPSRHDHFSQPYDGEVAYADELVGRFLDRLKAAKLYERAIIVLTSDHGEGLGQHGEKEHGIFLYSEDVHVPLVIRLPGGARRGTRVAGPVAQVDVPATLLDLAGFPAEGLDGVSLRAALEGRRPQPRPVYAEALYGRYHFGWSELYAVTDDRFRYIRAPRRELYDRVADRGETRNLADGRKAAADAMDAWLTRQVDVGQTAAPEEVPAEEREKLQALGYIGGGSSAAASAGDRADPKDKIGTYEELSRALGLREAGRDAEAVTVFQAIVKANPAMIDAWEMLGYTLIRMGRTPEGIAAVDQALKIDPTRNSAHLALAKVYALDGKVDRAIQHAEVASRKDPGQAFETLAELMMDKHDEEKAVAFARRAVAADPKRVMAHFILGGAAQRAGRYEEAVREFRDAAEAKRLFKQRVVRNLHANLADCLARLGREAEAETEFQEELKAIPTSEQGRVGLAMLYRSQGRDAEARAALAGLIAALPAPKPENYLTVIRTFGILGDVEAAREWAARGHAAFPNDPRLAPAPTRSSR
jgi:arylsulfatase A-like enzyme/Tfp pilus assembly protein PilF